MTQRQATDPHFPQMPRALNMTRMREIFQKELWTQGKTQGGASVVQTCQIDAQRYKPGKSCVFTYRLKILNTETEAVREQILCARLCKAGEGAAEFQRAKQKNLAECDGLPPVFYLPALEMVVWVFPNDRKLTHLPKMLDLPFLYDFLPQKLAALDFESKRLKSIKAQVVHYLPERSCMMRYTLDLEDRKTGAVRSKIVFGKIYPDDSGRVVYTVMEQLWPQSEGLNMARPLGYDATLKALWQSALPGKPFRAEEIKAPHCGEIMREMAVTVAALHRCKLEGAPRFEVSEIKDLLKETLDVVADTQAQWSDRVRLLVERLLAQAEKIGFASAPLTPIHGDLKIGNMLVDAGKVALIDMDCVRLGDPLCDLGSFIANFYYNGIRAGCDVEGLRPLAAEFRRVYAECVKWEVSQARLHWHIAAAFVYEIIRRSIRQQNVERLKHMDQYLDLSERYCFQEHWVEGA